MLWLFEILDYHLDNFTINWDSFIASVIIIFFRSFVFTLNFETRGFYEQNQWPYQQVNNFTLKIGKVWFVNNLINQIFVKIESYVESKYFFVFIGYIKTI